MYVCVCRGITDRQVAEAVCNGAKCVRDVNECIGIPIQCGKCCMFIKKVISETITNLTEVVNHDSLASSQC